MSNEIKHSLNSYGTKNGQTVRAAYEDIVTLTGNVLESKTQDIATSSTGIVIPAGTKVAIIRNIGPTNSLNLLESDETTPSQTLALNDWTFLRPPAAGRTYHAKANTAGVTVSITLYGT